MNHTKVMVDSITFAKNPTHTDETSTPVCAPKPASKPFRQK
ncbi:hypothetical protein OAF26_03380 [Akkermansiaceae bacterium]|nr:hypothetical protein [Akkermansiaceae bacterium]